MDRMVTSWISTAKGADLAVSPLFVYFPIPNTSSMVIAHWKVLAASTVAHFVWCSPWWRCCYVPSIAGLASAARPVRQGGTRRSCVYCLCNSSVFMLLSFRCTSLPTRRTDGLTMLCICDILILGNTSGEPSLRRRVRETCLQFSSSDYQYSLSKFSIGTLMVLTAASKVCRVENFSFSNPTISQAWGKVQKTNC